VERDRRERLDRIPDADAKGMAYVRLIKAFSFPARRWTARAVCFIPHGATAAGWCGQGHPLRGRGFGIWKSGTRERFLRQFAAARENAENLMAYVTDRYFGMVT
jgi:hypothetical protein